MVCRLMLQLYILLSSAKLHILVLSIKRKILINKLKNNGPKIEPCGTPLCLTTHYKKNLFSFFVYDFLGSYVSNLIHFYQYHRLQILQQEDHEVESHRL